MIGHIYNEVEERHIITIDSEDLAQLFKGNCFEFERDIRTFVQGMLMTMCKAEREAHGI